MVREYGATLTDRGPYGTSYEFLLAHFIRLQVAELLDPDNVVGAWLSQRAQSVSAIDAILQHLEARSLRSVSPW